STAPGFGSALSRSRRASRRSLPRPYRGRSVPSGSRWTWGGAPRSPAAWPTRSWATRCREVRWIAPRPGRSSGSGDSSPAPAGTAIRPRGSAWIECTLIMSVVGPISDRSVVIDGDGLFWAAPGTAAGSGLEIGRDRLQSRHAESFLVVIKDLWREAVAAAMSGAQASVDSDAHDFPFRGADAAIAGAENLVYS